MPCLVGSEMCIRDSYYICPMLYNLKLLRDLELLNNLPSHKQFVVYNNSLNTKKCQKIKPQKQMLLKEKKEK